MTIPEIGFRVDVEKDASPDWPVVTILVDGEDVIGRATGFKGFDPDEIFGRGSPLLPVEPPRRVAVYRCSCGEPGCGCAACLIAEEGGLVRWSDFRDFVGVYVGPLLDEEPEGGKKHPLPDLRFDVAQYREAVRLASRDRTWETSRRRRARLLRAELLSARAFEKLGYRVGWVSPLHGDEHGMRVEIRNRREQVVLRIKSDPDLSDEASAREMAARLESTPERRWDVLHRNDWPPGMEFG